jgi:translation initiation factor IF-2
LRIYNTFGKVKKIYNRKGQEVKKAVGGDPIMVLGINDVPEAGKLVEAVKDEKTAKAKMDAVAQIHVPTGVNAIVNKIAEGQNTQVNLLIKADSW